MNFNNSSQVSDDVADVYITWQLADGSDDRLTAQRLITITVVAISLLSIVMCGASVLLGSALLGAL